MTFWIRTASGLMALAIILGSFGAHGLESRLTVEMMEVYHTAIFYHVIHSLACFIIAWLVSISSQKLIPIAGYFFLAGIFLFSGSLYALSITGIKWLGMITPFGGVAFIAGWIFLAWRGIRRTP